MDRAKKNDLPTCLTEDEIFTNSELTPLPMPMVKRANGKPGMVFVRKPTVAEVMAFHAMREGVAEDDPERSKKMQESMNMLVAALVVNEAGTPIFTPKGLERMRELTIDRASFLSTNVLRICFGMDEGDSKTGVASPNVSSAPVPTS